ncbi:hypothetical protein DO97_08110 [Neosynechococcus sphagnicola sy1]|uniref:RND transporter n=1 Tax=Neosynechococcus sphagnicola sy1 TaxID=1497020 RepID=A0A098TJR0_9CYAN|nr:hypothetical protein DO97_08110 [Neosynechococcus sphagnicola sy1]
MSISDTFIKRPVLTTVCSLVILLAGLIALPLLPIAKLPQIAPSRVNVVATYSGADAKTAEDTVTTIVEREINGVENMQYMSSNTSNNGVSNISVAFPTAINRNEAQVNVQNRVSQATPKLPEVVNQTGVSVKAASPNILLAYAVYSEKNAKGQPIYDTSFISNYIDLFVLDEIKRIYGVGDALLLGERKYAMRIWLDPNQLAARNLTTSDVVTALQQQNIQVGAGRIGQEPISPDIQFAIPLRAAGRFKTAAEAANLVLRVGEDGTLIRIKDVGRAELGAENYDLNATFNGEPTAGLTIYQLPGTNALDTANNIKDKMAELEQSFPPASRRRLPLIPACLSRWRFKMWFPTPFKRSPWRF